MLPAGAGGGAPSLADLDADGAPEVIIGDVVLNGLTGDVIWDGDVTVGQSSGVGNNAQLGPSSTVADLDLDGLPEVIAGNTVYDGRTGAEVWSYPYTTSASPCGGDLPCDGFNAVGNFDADPEGEIVIIRRGEAFVLNHDGTLLHQVIIPRDDVVPYLGDGPCANNESGPPASTSSTTGSRRSWTMTAPARTGTTSATRPTTASRASRSRPARSAGSARLRLRVSGTSPLTAQR